LNLPFIFPSALLSIFNLENGKFTNNLAWPSAVANCKKVKIRISKKAMELWGCSAAKYELQTQTTRGDIREQHGQVSLAQSNATAICCPCLRLCHLCSFRLYPTLVCVVFSTCKNLLEFCVRIIT